MKEKNNLKIKIWLIFVQKCQYRYSHTASKKVQYVCWQYIYLEVYFMAMLFKLSARLYQFKFSKFKWPFRVTSITYVFNSASWLITTNTVSCYLFYLAAFKNCMRKTCGKFDYPSSPWFLLTAHLKSHSNCRFGFAFFSWP